MQPIAPAEGDERLISPMTESPGREIVPAKSSGERSARVGAGGRARTSSRARASRLALEDLRSLIGRGEIDIPGGVGQIPGSPICVAAGQLTSSRPETPANGWRANLARSP